MVIGSSTVGMESARRYSSVRMDAFSFSTWNNAGMLSNQNVSARQGTKEAEGDAAKSNMSAFQRSMNQLTKQFTDIKAQSVTSTKQDKDSMMKIKAQCIDYLIRLLFGRKSLLDDVGSTSADLQNADTGSQLTQEVSGGSFSSFHFFEETEETAFSTEGKVITADGREISFDLSFQMSRSFTEYYSETHSFGTELIDPLVINLDSDVASVSDQKFLFDIDSDGILDNISRLGSGSGFLALDQNGDGVINDGSELFGTKSGDGFSDLAKFDSDHNGWIDEADEIWDKLMIFTKDDNGKDLLYGLKDKGVGAIYLGNVNTQFALNARSDRAVNAVIQKTGMFLFENGRAGTVQHVDLAKAQ
ncbi:MAG: hypothetical protein GX567_02625 [Clostridia bacterium]|nr:hypothetical protein [Clostridia bacterium]